MRDKVRRCEAVKLGKGKYVRDNIIQLSLLLTPYSILLATDYRLPLNLFSPSPFHCFTAYSSLPTQQFSTLLSFLNNYTSYPTQNSHLLDTHIQKLFSKESGLPYTYKKRPLFSKDLETHKQI